MERLCSNNNLIDLFQKVSLSPLNQELLIQIEQALEEILDSKDYSIEKLAQEYGIPKADLYSEDDFIFDKGKAEEVFLISKLWKIFYKKIKENGQEDLLFNIEQPLSKVLADMETVGFEIDKEGLESYGEEISLQLKETELEIYKLAVDLLACSSGSGSEDIFFKALISNNSPFTTIIVTSSLIYPFSFSETITI